MDWNRTMGGAARKKRHTYPAKTAMNLYFKEDRTTKPATVILYVLLVAVLLAAAGKFLVFDRLQESARLEAEAVRLESQAAQVMGQLEEYAAVEEAYTRLAPTQGELDSPDPMAVLELIDLVIRPAADIAQVTVRDRQVLVRFSGVDLVETAELVSQLEQSPLVAGTTVDTAAAGERGPAVDVDMLIELAAGEEGVQP